MIKDYIRLYVLYLVIVCFIESIFNVCCERVM